MKATPTEYAGVRFRSKSEAVFACFLQQAGVFWEYEPVTSDGHVWDFYACSRPARYNTMQKQLSDSLIEYKPTRPTETYVENLKKHNDIGPKKHIVFGSPWTPATRNSVYAVMYNMTKEVIEIGGQPEVLKSIRLDLNLFSKATSLRRIAEIVLISDEEYRANRLMDIRQYFERAWGCEFSSVLSLDDHEGNLSVRCLSVNTEVSMFFHHAWEKIGNEPRENVELIAL